MKRIELLHICMLAALFASPTGARATDFLGQNAAPPLVEHNWTGCYLGGFVGVATGGSQETWTLEDQFFTPYQGAESPYGYNLSDSISGGALVGCNYQAYDSSVVLGLEGEIGAFDMNGGATEPFAPGGDTTASTSIDGYWAVSARLGYAYKSALFYAKAGVAQYEADTTVVDTCSAAPCGPLTVTATGSTNDITYAVGGGIEYQLSGNWTARGEYLQLGPGGDQWDFIACGVASNSVTYCSITETQPIHTAKFVLTRKLN